MAYAHRIKTVHLSLRVKTIQTFLQGKKEIFIVD